MKPHRVLAVLLILTLGIAPLLPGPQSWALAGAPEALSPAEMGTFSAAHAAYLLNAAPTVAGTPTTSAQAQQSVARWTLMVYMAADNDLERFALSDLNEMEIVGSTTEMNIVVQIDRAAGYDTSDGDWSETRRYFVTRDRRLSRLGSEPVEGFSEETNTGDPATLSDFATWAMTTYPAERYGLIIWDHGGSWLGVATDDSANQDDLILPELDEALAAITRATGREKLDLVGFDACLMGAFEVYQTVTPYARYGIGSAELIPGNGWDYMGALNALAADPSVSGDVFGRAVVDSFMTFYTSVVTSYPIFNLAVVDLAQTANVTAALDTLNQVVSDDPDGATEAIVTARISTPEYGAFNDPQYADVWAAADLIQFLLRLRDSAQVEHLSSAAASAASAAQSMIIYYRSSTDEAVKAGARAVIDGPVNAGMSIYFPQDARTFLRASSAKRYSSEAPAAIAQWSALLNTLFNLALSTLNPANMTGGIMGISGSGAQANIDLDPNLSALSRAALVVLLDLGGGQKIVIDYSPTSDTSASWNGRVPYLTNGQSQLPVLVLRNRANPNIGIVNGRFLLPDGSTLRAQLVFDLTTNQLLSVWGLRPSANSLMPFELVIEQGDLFQPSWITLTGNNRLFSIPAAVQLTVRQTPFRLVWQRAPVGAYHVTLLINDAAGNSARSSRPIAITSEDEDDLGLIELDPNSPDMDGDGLPNDDDNCPANVNPDQADSDEDGVGDACDFFDDRDLDDDGVPRGEDNCLGIWNADQADSDGDGIGDACEGAADRDGDGIPDSLDNCPDVPNPFQLDDDHDGLGNKCDSTFDPDDDYWDDFWGYDDEESDLDSDGIDDEDDNCPYDWNADQADSDANGVGDACEAEEPGPDSDGDGVTDSYDNCPDVPNPDQADRDGDGVGDACPYSTGDLDQDDDGVADYDDNCPGVWNPDQADLNGDGYGDVCQPAPRDPDSDGDGVTDSYDNCPSVANTDQSDDDDDGIGNACETVVLDSDGDGFPDAIDYCPTVPYSSNTDIDGDGVGDGCDNCIETYNPAQADSNGDGIGDACSAQADISATVTVDNPSPLYMGEPVNTQLMVTNNGPNDSTNIGYNWTHTVYDCLDGVPTVTNGSGSIASLMAGEYALISIAMDYVGSMGPCSSLTNATVMGGTPPDPNTSNNNSSGSFTYSGGMANVGVLVRVSNPAPTYGEQVLFTITVTNYGPAYVTAVDYARSIGFTSCTGIPGSGTTGLTPLGELDVGASITQTLSYTAGDICSANVGASVANIVPDDPDSSNNSAAASFTYTPPDFDSDGVPDSIDNCPNTYNPDQIDTDANGQGDACDPLTDLAVNVWVSNPAPAAGETVTFIINISNNGPNAATADYSATLASLSCGSPPVAGDGFVGPMMIGPIAPGATITQGTYTFTAGADCNANLWAGVGNASPRDWNTGNDGSGASFSYTPPTADIGVIVTVSNPNPANGDTVEFWMHMTNNGPNDASNIGYSMGYSRAQCWPPASLGPISLDTLPSLAAGQTYSAMITSMLVGEGGVCSGSADASVNSSTPADPDLGNQSSAASFSFTAPDGDGDSVPDWADNCPAVSNGDQTDTDANGQGDACDPVTDIGVVVTASTTNPTDGELVTFTMTITNNGPLDATNIQYGYGYTYTICSPPSGGGPTYMGSPISLTVGQTYTADLISFTAGTYCGGSANASLGGSTPRDWTTGNNSSSASFTYP